MSVGVQIVENLPPEELTLAELNSMSVKQLKSLVTRLGESTDGCVEKADLVRRALSSDRIVLVPEPEPEPEPVPPEPLPTGLSPDDMDTSA